MKHRGHCAYCSKYGRMTKEHVVPHCYGGQVKIWACSECNNRRGHSGKDPLFLKWLQAHEEVFSRAVLESKDYTQTDRWLQLEGLHKYRVPLVF